MLLIGTCRKILFSFLVSACFFSASVYSYSPNRVTGYWQTIDNITNKPAGIVKISLKDGKYYGSIVRRSRFKTQQHVKRCKKCRGGRYNKPILGLIIMRNFVWDPYSKRYIHGLILDPRNGKEYRAYMRLADNGKFLQVRGYLLTPILGRTMVWERAEKTRKQLH